MYKLLIDEGTWSGDILFQSSKGFSFNIEQKATCQLEVVQSINVTSANGIIRIIDQIEEYVFSLYLSPFEATLNNTKWHYKDSRFGNVWGKLVCIEQCYLSLGISEDNEYSFTGSIEAIDRTYLLIKGFTLFDRNNILSWSLHLKKLETSVEYQMKVAKPKSLKQSIKPITDLLNNNKV